ncbi:serine/threonine-protein kinase [Amycolatopsis lurida]
MDEETGESVALKLRRGDLRREAELAAKIRHPGVVRLHELTLDGADQWLVMEYVSARSLATKLREGGKLEPAEAARIGAQLAGALGAVHKAGIVHRDVTPANALITEDGTAKLTDFGISRPI